MATPKQYARMYCDMEYTATVALNQTPEEFLLERVTFSRFEIIEMSNEVIPPATYYARAKFFLEFSPETIDELTPPEFIGAYQLQRFRESREAYLNRAANAIRDYVNENSPFCCCVYRAQNGFIVEMIGNL